MRFAADFVPTWRSGPDGEVGYYVTRPVYGPEVQPADEVPGYYVRRGVEVVRVGGGLPAWALPLGIGLGALTFFWVLGK